MRRLSSLILFIVVPLFLPAQTNPHGSGFEVTCTDCHSTTGWSIDLKNLTFNHGKTKFPLVGQHQAVSCRQCHRSLKFADAGTECIDCHTDMHNQTVGPDCARCHTPSSWVVNNITDMHQRSRFPLVGAHTAADCYDCHVNASASLLNFAPLGIECFDCHKQDYTSTTNPDHEAGNFSTDCSQCHSISAFSWTGAGFNHAFFPLTQGHAIADCQRCHKTPDYASTSPVCVSCHSTDYNSTNNPNHGSLGFSTNCTDCHTTNPGWKPAEYRDHDAKSFPIYSGKHAGTWNSCSECHPNPANYAEFTCLSCHEHNQSETNNQHEGVQGYAYNSPACLACHPTGSGEGIDHTLIYPLTGAHALIANDCSACHANGYPNTPNTCAGCHTPNYNASTNPNHATLGIPTECNTCHTTDPGWKPATFAIHNNYYVLLGAHTSPAVTCADCHQGNYNNTPNTCDGCHLADYNQTSNPPHAASQFPHTCADCHSQTAWTPANWDHDGKYFPIYSGKHKNEWNSCSDCHNNPGNYQVFTCTTSCHPQSSTNSEHQGVSGYSYNSVACYNCHPTGSGGKMFNRIDRRE